MEKPKIIPKADLSVIPPQYRGLSSEIVEEIWKNPTYVDPKKNQEEKLRRDTAIAAIKEQEKQKERQSKNPEKKEELIEKIKKLYKKIYSQRRMSLHEDLFCVSIGIFPDTMENFDLVLGEVGRHFDAHGIAKSDQLAKLLYILENGIDFSRPFHTAPFEVPDEIKSGLGAGLGTSGGTAFKDGIAVLTGGYKQSLKDGIKHVFLNDVYADLKQPLSELFPQYKIHLLSEQKKVLEDEAKENN